MSSKREITLPKEVYRLEEINLPQELASALAGKVISVEVTPEREALTKRFDEAELPGDLPFLIDPQGDAWNNYWPMQGFFTNPLGRIWRIPRHWLTQGEAPLREEAPYEVTREVAWTETIHLPSWWDLRDINIPSAEARKVSGRPKPIEVHVAPHQQVVVFWRDASGKAWRVPHDWRRRRINLPTYEGLLKNDVPPDVAEEFAGKVVSVNYHPGSLCCLPDGYRFRDGHGGRWPVRAADCILLGYGDEEEKLG